MRNFWDIFTVKLGGKKLFDAVAKYDLARDIRMTVLAVMKMDDRCKFFISALPIEELEAYAPDAVRLVIYARHLPPWWASTMADAIRESVAPDGRMAHAGLNISAMFSTTPLSATVDEYFPDRPRVVGVVPNKKRIVEFLKERGLGRADIEPFGIQPANGLVKTRAGAILHFNRSCYDIVPGTESEPAENQYLIV